MVRQRIRFPRDLEPLIWLRRTALVSKHTQLWAIGWSKEAGALAIVCHKSEVWLAHSCCHADACRVVVSSVVCPLG